MVSGVCAVENICGDQLSAANSARLFTEQYQNRRLVGRSSSLSFMYATNAITRQWILNLAIEFPRRVSHIVPFVDELRLNAPNVPQATPNDYVAALLDLFDSGSIRLRSASNNGQGEVATDRSDLESVLKTRMLLPPGPRMPTWVKRGHDPLADTRAIPDSVYELSQRGGEEWETRAEPAWENYVEILSGEESGEGWSANLDSLMVELGWCRELNGVDIDRKTLAIEVLRGHPITYWKTLPTVYHATFRNAWVEDHWPGKGPLELKWFRDWWVSRSQWHKRPWELPDWPDAEKC